MEVTQQQIKNYHINIDGMQINLIIIVIIINFTVYF